MRTIAMLFALVVPVMAQEQTRSTHWGAGGQMRERPAKPAHWGAAAKMPERKDAHQRILEKYDANRDGKLDESERKAMKKD